MQCVYRNEIKVPVRFLFQGTNSRPGPTENSADVENILKVSALRIATVVYTRWHSFQTAPKRLAKEQLSGQARVAELCLQPDRRWKLGSVDKPIFSPIQVCLTRGRIVAAVRPNRPTVLVWLYRLSSPLLELAVSHPAAVETLSPVVNDVVNDVYFRE